MSTLTVVAKLKARPGSEAALHQKLTALVAPTLAEAGCVRYELNRSHEDPSVFLFCETWESKPLWEAHMKAPHLEAFSKEQESLTESWELFVGEPA